MSWCNNYTHPAIPTAKAVHDASEPYDINCAIPLNLAALENERIKLTPFVPKYHAAPFLEQVTKHPQLYRYIPFPLPNNLSDVTKYLESKFKEVPGHVFFAIHDKTRPSSAFEKGVGGGGSFAGTIALINTSIPDLSTEVGVVVIFPDYQRTHVLSNAAGLLIQYCLNLPSDVAAPGIGYRRVQWLANSENVRSIQAAERLGFQKEGTIRWHRVLPEGKEGMKSRGGDPIGEVGPGRHTVVLGICWDDWISGANKKLKTIMERR